jgi:hypothetical protein
MSRGNAGSENSTLAGKAPEGERRPGLRALGGAVSRIAAPIVARGGGTLARLKADWPAIIGAESAAATWPDALSRDGVLKLRVASERALEIQHRAPSVIERINLFLGRDAVLRIVLVQGPPLPLSGDEARALDGQLAAVSDPELRAALARLGHSVVAMGRRRR